MSDDEKFLRHKHLFTFLNFWDGILSWEDFRLLAEKFAKIQRRGRQPEKEVVERWKSIFEKWWNELTSYADSNKDKYVEFHEWLDFFKQLGRNTKSFAELPEFLKIYLQLFFLCCDANKDGLFCVKDYKKYIANLKMDTSKAQEHFDYMLTDDDRTNNENALNSDRFKATVYDFWVSMDPNSKGKFICGPFDSIPVEELEKRVKKKP
ncbi:sarcoplasmic calcium-binding protein, beta chain-like isoform X2 [Dermatophagoides pteronyssinus]|uniref:sarcoplasmic calcium-binding protein, beta chain-like isoform X2 n=1 Tax=Dermatophagoides pteronyssinus TaxID=6956 RepID=UPI003F66E779